VTRSLSFWFARKYGRNRPDTWYLSLILHRS